jgi:hypothetical protein
MRTYRDAGLEAHLIERVCGSLRRSPSWPRSSSRAVSTATSGVQLRIKWETILGRQRTQCRAVSCRQAALAASPAAPRQTDCATELRFRLREAAGGQGHRRLFRRGATLSSGMSWRLYVLIVSVLVLTVAGSVGASAGTRAVSVHVQRKPNVAGNVHISFRPTDHLPAGGYYYAVIVLKPYKHYPRKTPPPCATSSDMQKTDYGYPHPGRPVRLALTPAKSVLGHWCRGGVYSGGIYAVPHAPPCSSSYNCSTNGYEYGSCSEVEGRKLCGIVVRPRRYSYLDGLPKPIDHSTRIIGRFQVTF